MDSTDDSAKTDESENSGKTKGDTADGLESLLPGVLRVFGTSQYEKRFVHLLRCDRWIALMILHRRVSQKSLGKRRAM